MRTHPANKGNTAQFWCADCAVRIFVRLSENRGEYFLYWPRFSGNMTEHYASKMRAKNYAVLPKNISMFLLNLSITSQECNPKTRSASARVSPTLLFSSRRITGKPERRKRSYLSRELMRMRPRRYLAMAAAGSGSSMMRR